MEPKNALLFVVFMLILLWFVWLFTGGPKSERAQGGPFLKPLAPLDTGETYGEDSFFRRAPAQEKPTSLFAKTVTIRSAFGAKESDPNKEFVEIEASPWNKSTLVVTGWSLKTPTGKITKIGNASNVPKQGAINYEASIALEPGDRLVIATGRSPIGVSFRENICSGYLEQFQDFSPPILKSCPSATLDLSKRNLAGEASCVSFAARIDTCKTPLTGFPGDISNACLYYAQNDLTYNGCVALHQNERFFFTDIWRFYAGENKEIWSNKGGVVRLYDESGSLVDSLVY